MHVAAGQAALPSKQSLLHSAFPLEGAHLYHTLDTACAVGRSPSRPAARQATRAASSASTSATEAGCSGACSLATAHQALAVDCGGDGGAGGGWGHAAAAATRRQEAASLQQRQGGGHTCELNSPSWHWATIRPAAQQRGTNCLSQGRPPAWSARCCHDALRNQ